MKAEEERLLREQEEAKRIQAFKLDQEFADQLKDGQDEGMNMFGDIQSDNEDDFVMPPFNEENPAVDDSPEQQEADDDKLDGFEDIKDETQQIDTIVLE